jgi:hypothetical protein
MSHLASIKTVELNDTIAERVNCELSLLTGFGDVKLMMMYQTVGLSTEVQKQVISLRSMVSINY